MWSDKESSIDFLNFSELSESIRDLIVEEDLLPLSIGVFGDWGAGKSSVLELTKDRIAAENSGHIQIHFDAWLFQGYDDAKAALLEAIARELISVAEARGNQTVISRANKVYKRVDKIRALGMAMDIGATAFGIPTGGAISKLIGFARDATDEDGINEDSDTQEAIAAGQKLVKDSQNLLKAEKKLSPPEEIMAFRDEYASLLEALDSPLIVYVDNLDRCSPVNAISTLEAIRLFLFLPNTAFVVAADVDMIRTAVQEYHKGSSKRHQTDYLDKLIQVPIHVPKPGQLEIRAYVLMLMAQDLALEEVVLNQLRSRLEKDLREAWKGEQRTIDELFNGMDFDEKEKAVLVLKTAEKLAPILATSPNINGNPRIVKRLLNQIKMRKKIASRRGMLLDEATLTKLVIFERCVGTNAARYLYQLIETEDGKPDLLLKLEEGDCSFDWPDEWLSEQDFIMAWARLPPSFSDKNLLPAAYLSRESIPLGQINTVISAAAQNLLIALIKQANRTSKANTRLINETPKEEYMAVMEGLIENLGHIEDYTKMPSGVMGGVLLADHDEKCKALFKEFLISLPKQRWITSLIKSMESK
ncbi:ATPase [Vibrio parahaemolyticus]|uniref:KAP family P-loop NTPase fold protein n=1 Tax=Vibrio parahaemolyticus TaxID=670 RepID=UPI000417B060|nr:P-loop NTPase fold protein [Vibrio parahaemolyticus]MBE4346457.1 ATPase [Vibrio parahaemolyticus]MDF4748139.1 P-loop NTPase fold protein [Vibrio parahaemolyticus]MDF5665115.1 P-loop NTPase fold protein [Vibrio parahaemolyticus]